MANKQDLVQLVEEVLEGQEFKTSKKEATLIVDTVLESIIELTKKGKLSLFGFGTFDVRERVARKGYNPKLLQELKAKGLPEEQAKAQAQIDIDASKAPAFKPAKAFKEKIK